MDSSGGPAHRVESAVVEYGYPSGHLGHLTPTEEKALKEFKALVIEKGLYKPASAQHEFGTHDDAMLLRFLRARRFDVQGAFNQFKETEDWRIANNLDTLYETIDLEDYDETRKLYPQWTGRRDRRGIPVYVYEVKHLNSKTMAAYEKSAAKTQSKAASDGKTPAKMLRLFALYENLVRFVMPLCTDMTDRQHSGTPITQSNNIVDISDVGLKQFWNLRAHMQDASTLATAHYPETLDRIFIIGAPSFFPTVWGWIKRWFDPITTSKIFILAQPDVKKTLESFIEPDNIPIKYGGTLQYKFGDMPVLDPAMKEAIEWESGNQDFPHGPMFWVNRGDKIELMAAGSVGGKERKEQVCIMQKKFRGGSVDDTNNAAAASTADKPSQQGEKEEAAVAAQATATTAAMDKMSVNDTAVATEKAAPTSVATEGPAVAVQSGEIVPATRPEPTSFVTAHDNLHTLKSPEEVPPLPTSSNGHAVASTTDSVSAKQAAPVDSKVASSELNRESVDAHDVHEKHHGSAEQEKKKKHHSLKDKLKEKLHV